MGSLPQAPPAAAAKSLQLCPTLCDPIDSSPSGSPVPGILQSRTRVGCHFLLQCMKVKIESEVAQSCQTLRHPIDRSLPGSSVHGIFQARVLEWGAVAFSDKHHIVSFMRWGWGRGESSVCLLLSSPPHGRMQQEGSQPWRPEGRSSSDSSMVVPWSQTSQPPKLEGIQLTLEQLGS